MSAALRRGPLVPAWVRLLVALHPRDFRDRFGDELRADAASVLAEGGGGRSNRRWFLLRDLLASAARQQAASRRAPHGVRHAPELPPTRPPTAGERMHILLQDLRYAFRSLSRVPGFTLTVMVSLALGIGANTLVYSLVDGLLLRPFPFPDAKRLVAVGVRYAEDDDRRFIESMSPAEYEDIRTSSRTLERFFAFDLGNRNISGSDLAERVFTAFIWGDPFATIGMRPWLGRGFTEDETASGAGNAVAILSHRVWQSRFGSDSSVVGRAIEVNGVPRTVVGIMPRSLLVMGTDLWLPMGVSPTVIPRRARQWAIVARMRDGVSMDQVQVDLSTTAGAVARTWEGTHPEYRQWSLAASRWGDVVSAPVRPAALVMLGTVAFVLLRRRPTSPA